VEDGLEAEAVSVVLEEEVQEAEVRAEAGKENKSRKSKKNPAISGVCTYNHQSYFAAIFCFI